MTLRNIDTGETDLAIWQVLWADIRSLTSNIWQVTALAMSVLVFGSTLLLTIDGTGQLIFLSWPGWYLMLFLTMFTYVITLSIIWITDSIDARVLVVPKHIKTTRLLDFSVIIDGKKLDGRVEDGFRDLVRKILSYPTAPARWVFNLTWLVVAFLWLLQPYLAGFDLRVLIIQGLLVVLLISYLIFRLRRKPKAD